MEFIYLHSDRGWWAHRPLPRHNGAPAIPGPGTILGWRDQGRKRHGRYTGNQEELLINYCDHRHRHSHRILLMNYLIHQNN